MILLLISIMEYVTDLPSLICITKMMLKLRNCSTGEQRSRARRSCLKLLASTSTTQYILRVQCPNDNITQRKMKLLGLFLVFVNGKYYFRVRGTMVKVVTRNPRIDLVRDFQDYVRPGPVRSQIFKLCFLKFCWSLGP